LKKFLIIKASEPGIREGRTIRKKLEGEPLVFGTKSRSKTQKKQNKKEGGAAIKY